MSRSRLIVVFTAIAVIIVAVSNTGTLSSDELPSAAELQANAEQQCLVQRGATSALPPRPFKTDGCSLWPDGNWLHCCVSHDMDYWCGGTQDQRAASDLRLQQCVSAAGHPKTGATMQFGVYLAASRLLPTPWRWGFGWPWLSEQAKIGQ